ncbi:MAG: hypothetical protein CMG71_08335 [Candidatus Marinimicrobia bacterium]|nr:hypothetical protein [Candidatus Neomarinimicrobiota bacterium]|tara:strand:- start:8391 stop:9596 length:1206 start_codon:yes stop_codon:yes gene_type:complete
MIAKRIKHLSTVVLSITLAQGQSIKLMPDPGFVPYATYYISSIDLVTGATDVQFFGFRLAEESGDYKAKEVWASLEFKVTMVSPMLGIEDPTTVIHMRTNPFRMEADVRISNTALSTQSTSLFDMSVPPKEIDLQARLIETIDISKFEDLLSAVVSTGKLADGQYGFQVLVRTGSSSDEGSMIVTDEMLEMILVTTPTSLNLIGPGGEPANLSENTVFSLYPIFQWDTEPCSGCESLIRIAKYDSETHSSPEEAIQDVTVFPMDQTKGWESVGLATNFQYPLSDAIDLESGQAYVWQVQKKLPTTGGNESFTSPIFAFSVADLTEATAASSAMLHPVLQQLKDIIGDSQFQAYFDADGDLSGFEPSGTYFINGLEVSVDEVFRLLRQFGDGSHSMISISVE